MARRRQVQPTSPRQNELVAKLVANPANVPSYRVLVGHLGESADAGRTRLYRSLDLKSYDEVATRDVVHIAPIGPAGSALAPAMVWVRADAVVSSTTVGPASGGDFLQGDIVTRFLRLTSGSFTEGTAGPRPPIATGWSVVWCPTASCRTLFEKECWQTIVGRTCLLGGCVPPTGGCSDP